MVWGGGAGGIRPPAHLGREWGKQHEYTFRACDWCGCHRGRSPCCERPIKRRCASRGLLRDLSRGLVALSSPAESARLLLEPKFLLGSWVVDRDFSKYIFDNMVKNLEGGVKFLMYPRFVQIFLDKQVEGISRHKGIYVIPSHTKKVFANMKRLGKGFFGKKVFANMKKPGKDFSGKVTPLFETMMVQATKDMGEDSAAPTDSHSTPIHTQPSSSKP
ncbi:hypothetical protein Tco_0336957 [Tanacetum coccineum]